MSEKKTQTIGHCRECDFQWVVLDGTKGDNRAHIRGQRCPFCKSSSVYYTQELNR